MKPKRRHLQDNSLIRMKAGKRRCRKVFLFAVMEYSFEIYCDVDICRFSNFWRNMTAHIKMQHRHEIAGMN